MDKNQKTFPIGDAVKFAKVSHRQLRNWEERGYLGKVQRVVFGEKSYRRYTLQQIHLVSKITEYLNQGYTLKTAARKAGEVYPTVLKGGGRYA